MQPNPYAKERIRHVIVRMHGLFNYLIYIYIVLIRIGMLVPHGNNTRNILNSWIQEKIVDK